MHNRIVDEIIKDALRYTPELATLMDTGVVRVARSADTLDMAQWYRDTFSTESGRKVLAILISRTIMQPTVTPGSTQFEAGIREGRADIVRGILAYIELAETGGKETLQPWQTLTPPQPEPAQKPRKPRKPAAS